MALDVPSDPLEEKGRIKSDALEMLSQAIGLGDSALMEIPVSGEFAKKMREIPPESIPDIPDRIISAIALMIKVPVISRNGRFKVSGLQTLW